MERLGDEVRRELRRFGPQAGMAELVAGWPAAVGAQVARNAWPARLARDGTLHVATSSSAWAFELTNLAALILPRLQAALGEAAPGRLVFAPGKLPGPAEEDPGRPVLRPRAPGPVEVAAAERMAAVVSEPGLRERVAKALAASLARGPVDRSV
jgi:Dna[CI] antecedent, DciA